MRFACLLVEHLPLRVETLLQPGLADQPVAIVRAWDGRVLDASPEVLGSGVRPGEPGRRVEQLCPQAVLLPAHETLYQSHHDAVRAVLADFGGAVETRAAGELFVEVEALARTFPSELALAAQLLTSTQDRTRLPAVVGIASNKYTALQAAQLAAFEAGRVLAVPPGGERRFLAPLPLDMLPDSPAEMIHRLQLFGINTLGGFADLPHAAVVLQFGPELAYLHNLARGVDPRPLAPQVPPPMLTRRLSFSDPLADRRMVFKALEHLASRLARELDRTGHHALALVLAATTANGQEQSAGTPIKPPSCDPVLLQHAAGRLLGKLEFDQGVTRLELTAYPLREWHEGARQMSLFDEPVQPRLARFRQALQMLKQRFGEAVILLAGVLGPPRPLGIEVGAGPDGAPVWLRWGSWSRLVQQVYEYWREEWGWWDQLQARDYYQVEVDGEIVFTVFRDSRGGWFLDRKHS